MPLARRLWPKSLAGKAGVATAAMLVTLVAAYLLADYFTTKRLAAAWKLGSEFGLANSLPELLGPYVPPEKNVATPLDELEPIARKFLADQNPKKLDYMELQNDSSFIARFGSLYCDEAYDRLLKEAERRDGYYTTAIFGGRLLDVDFNYIQNRRYLGRTERAVALWLASQGKGDEAARRLLRLLRITRRWENKEPFHMCWSVNLAVRSPLLRALNDVLRLRGPLTSGVHKEIDDELAAQERCADVVPWWLQTNMLLLLDEYDRMPLDRSPLGRVIGRSLLLKHGQARLLETGYQFQSLSRKAYRDAAIEVAEMERDLGDSPWTLAGSFPDYGRRSMLGSAHFLRSFTTFNAQARCLRVVNVLARLGNYEADFESLGLPKDTMLDPFDGKGLRVKKTTDGPIIYTLGYDLTDDGGDVDFPNPKDCGFGPSSLGLVTR